MLYKLRRIPENLAAFIISFPAGSATRFLSSCKRWQTIQWDSLTKSEKPLYTEDVMQKRFENESVFIATFHF